MNYIIFAGVLAAFFGNLYFIARYAAELYRRYGLVKISGAAAVFAGVFAVLFTVAAHVPLRGGYDNDHDFGYAGTNFFSLADVGGNISQKEYAPQLGITLGDIASGYSLRAVPLLNNTLLWPVWALLVFCALLELDAGICGAVFGSGLLAFSFLSILNARTFATTGWNMFFAASALLSAARFRGNFSFDGFIWFLCASFLVFCGRYELLPPLGLLAVLLLYGARAELLASWERYSVSTAVWLLLCLVWLWLLYSNDHYNGPPMLDTLNNFLEQLGAQNLSMCLGFGKRFPVFMTVFFFALLAIRGVLDGKSRFAVALQWVWVAVWVYYFSAIFMPLQLYPLHFMRHNLYFYIPFCILAGLGVSAIRFAPQPARKALCAALGLLLAAYGVANAGAALGLNRELRTNDMEWHFLLDARKNWPPDCVAVYPYQDSRIGIIAKYFPFERPADALRSGKRMLVYKSPLHNVVKVMFAPQDVPFTDFSNLIAPDYSIPVLSTTFTHKFYTIWHGSPELETEAEVPLTIGFYKALPKPAQPGR